MLPEISYELKLECHVKEKKEIIIKKKKRTTTATKSLPLRKSIQLTDNG